MKKLNKVAMLFASAALATAAGAQTVDNWKNGSGDLVWRTAPTNCAGAMPTGRLLRQLLAATALSLPRQQPLPPHLQPLLQLPPLRLLPQQLLLLPLKRLPTLLTHSSTSTSRF